ncbi:hypothetical protein ERN12_06010 [Rhodobacteraceae bacterium]|nr:hypothetical protein ERN12_06010 [Paracoccaceae bacterium]
MTAPRETWQALTASARRHDWSGQIVFGVDPVDVRAHAGGRMVYIASPGAAFDPGEFSGVEADRHILIAQRAGGDLAAQGVCAVAPLALASSYLDADPGLPINRARTRARWAAGLRNASGVIWIPDVQGWADCADVQRDADWAVQRGVPVLVQAMGVAS